MRSIDPTAHNWLVTRINNRIVAAHHHLLEGTVLDLGCGDSPYKTDILQTASKYVGLDWPSTFHDNSAVSIYADLQRALPFRSESVDAVTAFQVLEHVPGTGAVLAEAHRVLQSGGILLLTVPFMWQVHEAPHDYVRLTGFGLRYVLQEAGFDQIQIYENTGFWQMLALKFNYHSTRWCRGPLKILRYLLIPLWLSAQYLAPLLDKVDPDPSETVSYTCLARKGNED